MSDSGLKNIALLIDADNTSPKGIDPVLTVMAELGQVNIKRAYGNFAKNNLANWDKITHKYGIRPQQQFDLTAGKNATDMAMTIDAIDLLYQGKVDGFGIMSSDSDFTPLVQKLRELDRRVIGIGVRDSTSKLLPPACDEFLFYDRLEGVEASREASRKGGSKAETSAEDASQAEDPSLDELVISTLAGMQGSHEDVRASTLKRAILRIDPTFTESDHGFRGFTELLRHLADRRVVELVGAKRDPEVDLVTGDGPAQAAFDQLAAAVADASGGRTKGVAMSGLKTELRRRDEGFSERALGYSGFLQFCKAAAARDLVAMAWDDKRGDYVLSSPK